MKISSGYLSILLAFTAGLITACNLTSSASSGSSGSLGGDVSHLFVVLTGPHAIKAADASNTRAIQAEQVIGCPGIGTITSDDAALPYWPIKTCTGYYANLSEAPDSSFTSIPLQPQGTYQVFFDGQNCTGNAYTRESPGLSAKALTGGFVFFMDINSTGRNDADNYWVVKKGEATASATVFSSFLGSGPSGQCGQVGNSPGDSIDLTSIYPVKHNSDVLDQDGNPASGLASAPIQGPLNSGTP